MKSKDIAFLIAIAVILFVIVRLSSKLHETDQKLELVSAQMDQKLQSVAAQMAAEAAHIHSAIQQAADSKIPVTVGGFGEAV